MTADTFSGLKFRLIGPGSGVGTGDVDRSESEEQVRILRGRSVGRRLEDGQRWNDVDPGVRWRGIVFDRMGGHSIRMIRPWCGSGRARAIRSAASATATESTARTMAARVGRILA